jgi:hypothetical protein
MCLAVFCTHTVMVTHTQAFGSVEPGLEADLVHVAHAAPQSLTHAVTCVLLLNPAQVQPGQHPCREPPAVGAPSICLRGYNSHTCGTCLCDIIYKHLHLACWRLTSPSLWRCTHSVSRGTTQDRPYFVPVTTPKTRLPSTARPRACSRLFQHS